MTAVIELVIITCFAAFAYSQTTPNVHQTATRSSCANIVALSGAKVDCSNLTEAQKKALANIPTILKMALTDRDYFDAIMKKLDEISKAEAAPQQIVSAPSGIAIGGGTVTNPTVNNFTLPERHILEAEKDYLRGCLSKHAGSVSVSAIANDPEAYAFADDWFHIFQQAGWSIEEDRIKPFLIGGGMWTEMHIMVRGSVNSGGTNAKFDPNSAGENIANCLVNHPFEWKSAMILDPNYPPDKVDVQVGPRGSH